MPYSYKLRASAGQNNHLKSFHDLFFFFIEKISQETKSKLLKRAAGVQYLSLNSSIAEFRKKNRLEQESGEPACSACSVAELAVKL